MFEQKHQELIPVAVFVRRMVAYILLVILLILGILSIGVVGYHFLAGLTWVDSLLNASKIFASIYALFSGLVFIAIMGILFAPIMHRVLHSFHMEGKDLKK